MSKWTTEEELTMKETDFTLLSWQEIEGLFPDKNKTEIMKKMHEIGKTAIKNGTVNWYEDRPPSIVTELNKPNMELMAKPFLNLYYQTKENF